MFYKSADSEVHSELFMKIKKISEDLKCKKKIKLVAHLGEIPQKYNFSWEHYFAKPRFQISTNLTFYIHKENFSVFSRVRTTMTVIFL